jgi:hypothetical protein
MAVMGVLVFCFMCLVSKLYFFAFAECAVGCGLGGDIIS